MKYAFLQFCLIGKNFCLLLLLKKEDAYLSQFYQRIGNFSWILLKINFYLQVYLKILIYFYFFYKFI